VNKFLTGVMIGAGIGLIIAPMRGEEMRQRLLSRMQDMMGSTPMGDQIGNFRQKLAGQTSQTTDMERGLKNLGQAGMSSTGPNTLTSESPGSFTPAYPEYVNPNLTSNQ
jgi:gas vesicle protein